MGSAGGVKVPFAYSPALPLCVIFRSDSGVGRLVVKWGRFVATALLGTGLLLGMGAAGEASSWTLVNYQQEKSQWCWAAASKTVIQFKTGATPSQCSLVNIAKGTGGSGSTVNCPDWPGSIYGDVSRALGSKGLSGSVTAQFVPWISIAYDIDNADLIMLRYGYKSSGLATGHMVTIRGYGTYPYVYFVDPATGTNKVKTYSDLSDNSTWTVTHSRWGI